MSVKCNAPTQVILNHRVKVTRYSTFMTHESGWSKDRHTDRNEPRIDPKLQGKLQVYGVTYKIQKKKNQTLKHYVVDYSILEQTGNRTDWNLNYYLIKRFIYLHYYRSFISHVTNWTILTSNNNSQVRVRRFPVLYV